MIVDRGARAIARQEFRTKNQLKPLTSQTKPPRRTSQCKPLGTVQNQPTSGPVSSSRVGLETIRNRKTQTMNRASYNTEKNYMVMKGLSFNRNGVHDLDFIYSDPEKGELKT